MSILTKEERVNHRSRSEAATCSQWEIRWIARDVDFCPYTELIRALDTIDALEIERDELRKKFERTKSLSRLAPQTLTALLDRLERDERERSNAKEQE